MIQKSPLKIPKTERKIKVIFMIPNLTPGGAERVFAFISQNLTADVFETELLVTGKSEQTSYVVDKVSVEYLEKNRVLSAIPKLISYLARERPDIVLSSIGHLNMVSGFMSMIFPSIRFVIRPSNVESKDSSGWLVKQCFSAIDAVICQSYDMANNFSKRYGISMKKITIIGNPVTNVEEFKTEAEDGIEKTQKFITVGRLNKVKGHTRVLRILARLNKDFHYTIIGDGPERVNLLTQIDDLNLNSKITHISYTSKVNDYLLQSDLFLQGSYSEGFPNAVLESCTMGTPVLAFDVPGGTKEILENGTNGFLVSNEEEYLAALTKENKWNRSAIRQSVLSKFSPEIILSKYEDFLISVY